MSTRQADDLEVEDDEYEDEYEDDGEYEEEEEAPRKPAKQAAKPAKVPRANAPAGDYSLPDETSGQPRRGRGRRRRPERQADISDPFMETRRRSDDPFDFIGQPLETNAIRVERTRCNDEGSDETGHCGIVARELDFEKDIAKKWGGGNYLAVTMKNGYPAERLVKIGGPSKPIHKVKEDESEETEDEEEHEISFEPTVFPARRRYAGRRYAGYDDSYDDPYEDRFAGRSRWDDGYGRRGYGSRGGPYGGGPYGGGPYGQQGWGGGPDPYGQPQAPYGQPQAPYAPQSPYAPQGAYGQPPVGVSGYGQQQTQFGSYRQVEPDEVKQARDEELARLREQFEQAREEAAAEREERRVEAERAAAAEREATLKREIDVMKSESDRRLDQMKLESDRRAEEFRRQLEAMQQQAQQAQQQLMMQLQQAQSNKGADATGKMLELQMLQLQQAQQRTEQERLDREIRWREEQASRRDDAERRDKEWLRDKEKQEEVRREERRLEEDRRRDQEKHYQHMLTLMKGGQQTPEQMLAMLKTLVDMNPRKDATSQVMDLAQAALAMRELFSATGNEQAENKWESIIKTGGGALVAAIDKIQTGRQAAPAMQAPPAQAMPQGAPAQRQIAMQQAPPAQANPVAQEPSAEEWGRILSFVVGARESGNDPEETATHLYTMVTVGMQRPRAIQRLVMSSPDELKFQLSAVKLHPAVANSPVEGKIDVLISMLESQEGAEWFAELVLNLRSIVGAVTGAAPQPQQAQPQPQQAQPQPQAQPQAQPAQSQPQPQSQEEVNAEEFARRSRGGGAESTPAGGWDE